MIGVTDAVAIGREFVRQYYTILHVAPHYLYRFYGRDSSFACSFHPSSADSSFEPAMGQEGIRKRLSELDIIGYDVKVGSVDFQALFRNCIVVQVIGELSRNGKLMRRFNQTFVLALECGTKYYIHNDILHYHFVGVNSAHVGAVVSVGQQTNERQVQNLQVNRGEMIIGSPSGSTTNISAKSSPVPVFTTHDVSSVPSHSPQLNVNSGSSTMSVDYNTGAYVPPANASTSASVHYSMPVTSASCANTVAASFHNGMPLAAGCDATDANYSPTGVASAIRFAAISHPNTAARLAAANTAIATVAPILSTAGSHIITSNTHHAAAASTSSTSAGSAADLTAPTVCPASTTDQEAAAISVAAADAYTTGNATYTTTRATAGYTPTSLATNHTSLASVGSSLPSPKGSVSQVAGDIQPAPDVLPPALSGRYEEEFPPPPQRVGLGGVPIAGNQVAHDSAGPGGIGSVASGENPMSGDSLSTLSYNTTDPTSGLQNLGDNKPPDHLANEQRSGATVEQGGHNLQFDNISGKDTLSVSGQAETNRAVLKENGGMGGELGGRKGGHEEETKSGVAETNELVETPADDKPPKPVSWAKLAGKKPVTSTVHSQPITGSVRTGPATNQPTAGPVRSSNAQFQPTTGPVRASPGSNQPITGPVRTSPSAPSNNQQTVRKLPRAPNSSVGGGGGDGSDSVAGGGHPRRGSDASDASGWAGAGPRGFYPANQQLFVGNLPHEITSEHLATFLEGLAPGTKIIDLKINRNAQQYSKHHVPYFAFVTLNSKEAVRKILDLPPNQHYLDGIHRLNIMQKLPKSELQGAQTPRPRSGASYQAPPASGSVVGDSEAGGGASEHLEVTSGRGSMRQRYQSPMNVGTGRGNSAVKGEH